MYVLLDSYITVQDWLRVLLKNGYVFYAGNTTSKTNKTVHE